MNTIFKSKSELRAETEKQVQLFLKRGGSIEIIKPRKAPKQRMSGKVTKSGSTGTSGFATGFPRKSCV
jgi:hypothetical protein